MLLAGRKPGDVFMYPEFGGEVQFRKRISNNAVLVCAAGNSMEYVVSQCPTCKVFSAVRWDKYTGEL